MPAPGPLAAWPWSDQHGTQTASGLRALALGRPASGAGPGSAEGSWGCVCSPPCLAVEQSRRGPSARVCRL